eukprot:TRINITY_DN13042_c0_g1_i1.p1 TRINITY_DN13042_c0_g1~~TRINITY_DN13042_c0_g1_i1.p1  ORF type:complete len:183 (+),score=42.73 TRINITY_DN13042_c0_g1_i1:72-620(+)
MESIRFRKRGSPLAAILAVFAALAVLGPCFVAPTVPRREALLLSSTVLPLLGAAAPAFAAAREGFTETESGLQYKVIKEGTGDLPKRGAQIKADYTGWLDDFDSPAKFDSSRDRGRPLEFPVGTGKVIKGWDEALLNMNVGERRLIIVPPNIGYGNRKMGPIPPGSTLYFDVELKSIGRRDY